ncbi:MAG: hypothetical protein ACO29O_07450 [Chitinophagaceae bacterium]
MKNLLFDAKAVTAIDTNSNKIILYTGFEYTKGIILYNESPFFSGLNALPGRIKYQGEWYNDLQLKYDCKEDILILIDEENQREIELISEKLNEFNIQDHHFIKIKLPDFKEGYYELLHDGSRQLLVKWIKKTERNQMEEAHYVSYHQIYLKRDDQIFNIKTFKDFLRSMESNKKNIIQFCKDNHLRFKKEPFSCMKQVLSHFEKQAN